VPACFPRMGFSHDASLPYFGSQRARFPAFDGTMKALRLPSRVSTVAYLVRFRRPRFTPSVRVSPWRSRKIGGLSQARALGQPAPQFSGSSLRGHGWVLSGLQAIHPVPLLRSWTPVESTCPRQSGHIDAAPAIRTTRASTLTYFEADSRSFGTCSPTPRATIAITRKAGFPLADWPLPGGVEPSGSRWKVSTRIHDHPPSLYS